MELSWCRFGVFIFRMVKKPINTGNLREFESHRPLFFFPFFLIG